MSAILRRWSVIVGALLLASLFEGSIGRKLGAASDLAPTHASEEAQPEGDPEENDAMALESLRTDNFESLEAFLGRPDGRLSFMSDAEARVMLRGLQRAGAINVYAVDQFPLGNYRIATTIIIELPSEEAKRKAIYAELDEFLAKINYSPWPDIGETYLFVFGLDD